MHESISMPGMEPHISTSLSSSDAKILNTVFDPESGPEAPRVLVDPSLPPDAHITDLDLLSALRRREVVAVKLVEKISPMEPEEKKDLVYQEALAMLDAIISDHEDYASAWNNRAQLRRWRYGDRNVLTTKTEEISTAAWEARRTIIAALHDLDTAISLASPSSSSIAVSPAQGKLLAQAWTQRAAIFWGVAKDLGSHGTQVIPNLAQEECMWTKWSKSRFEEEGSRCFYMAGLYGSEVGKAMAVLSNPTAKLCGGIVKEAMRRERCGA